MAKKKATPVQEAFTEELSVNTPVSQETSVDAAQVEMPQLQLTDLQMLSKVIDVAATRGAFKADEFSQVGEVFNKLNAFLKYAEDAAKAASTEAAE